MRKLIILLLAASQVALSQPAFAQIQEEQVMPYLEEVITFNNSINETEQLPDTGREVLLKDMLKHNSRKILQKTFDFASAQAQIFDSAKPETSTAPAENDTSRYGRLLQAIANNKKSIEEIKEKLAAPSLNSAMREKLNGQLKLTLSQQELLKTMRGIFSSDDKSGSSLSEQVKALSRNQATPTDIAATTESQVAIVTAKESSKMEEGDGMLKLITTMFSHSQKQAKIKGLIDQTQELADNNREIATSIRASLRAAIEEGKTLAADEKTDAKSMADYRQSLAELMSRYKMLSSTIIPIGEINVLLDNTVGNLKEWDKLITDSWNRTIRQLITRLIILSIAVAIPFAFSSAAHRAITRYIKDPKRQRQLNIIRRIILSIFLAFIILANFISEFGSLATFAGFITAGLAVALQTVLVSLVAHFFFFGRYGIKAGDRVTISGVTGDVMQVGALRLYMRELTETDGKFVPSGKMVAFPNSILFQPTGFYKHIDRGEF